MLVTSFISSAGEVTQVGSTCVPAHRLKKALQYLSFSDIEFSSMTVSRNEVVSAAPAVQQGFRNVGGDELEIVLGFGRGKPT